MEPIKTIVNVGKYKFQIMDNTLSLRGQIYCRNFRIRGNNIDCVNVSITYNENRPVSASIPHIMYDEECSIFDRGNGSIIMINTLLHHIQQQIPTITEIHFEDKSNIECATEESKKASRNRKRGTNVYPVPLYYFSIAFNGVTWYEKQFKARQKDMSKHTKYRAQIDYLLNSKLHLLSFKSPALRAEMNEEGDADCAFSMRNGVKTNTSFLTFLEISKPPIEIMDELEQYYNKSDTYGDFFQSMPKKDRCRLVRDWISTFMTHHLKDFENTGWIIELPISLRGGKKTRKYYCPKGRIVHNQTYKDFGIDITNV